jgi:hypothetical protein
MTIKKGSVINIDNDEDLMEFELELKQHLERNNYKLDDEESLWDSEFNRIFVTYVYPDVTKVQ